MDHDSLDRLRQVHPAWRILIADHAPLVLSFLTLAFVQPNRRAIPAPEIAAHLDAYLDHLRETYAERYPRSARDYLEDWAAPNRAYLRKYSLCIADDFTGFGADIQALRKRLRSEKRADLDVRGIDATLRTL